MRPVSDALLRAVRGSHGMNARARVVTTFATGTNPTGTEIGIIDGSVDLDATADVRSTLDLTTPGRNMWPSRDNLLLAPYGNELFVERGVQFGGGTTEWCSLGYFRIDTPTQDVPPDGPINLTCSDRMANIVDAKLTAPRQYTAAQTFGAVVNGLVLDVLPSATIEWDDGTATSGRPIGRDVLVEQDRYKALRDLVTSVGKVAYWDHRGVLVIKTPPDPTVPVYEITHGKDGVLVSMSRELSRVGVHNGWVVTGDGIDNPVRAVVVDNNPASPTFWYGSFGQVPGFFSSPLVADQAQGQTAAAELVRQSLGLPYNVSFGTIPNPALEPLDSVRISYSDRFGREIHILERLSVPLTADAVMTGETREQTLVIAGEL